MRRSASEFPPLTPEIEDRLRWLVKEKQWVEDCAILDRNIKYRCKRLAILCELVNSGAYSKEAMLRVLPKRPSRPRLTEWEKEKRVNAEVEKLMKVWAKSAWKTKQVECKADSQLRKVIRGMIQSDSTLRYLVQDHQEKKVKMLERMTSSIPRNDWDYFDSGKTPTDPKFSLQNESQFRGIRKKRREYVVLPPVPCKPKLSHYLCLIPWTKQPIVPFTGNIEPEIIWDEREKFLNWLWNKKVDKGKVKSCCMDLFIPGGRQRQYAVVLAREDGRRSSWMRKFHRNFGREARRVLFFLVANLRAVVETDTSICIKYVVQESAVREAGPKLRHGFFWMLKNGNFKSLDATDLEQLEREFCGGKERAKEEDQGKEQEKEKKPGLFHNTWTKLMGKRKEKKSLDEIGQVLASEEDEVGNEEEGKENEEKNKPGLLRKTWNKLTGQKKNKKAKASLAEEIEREIGMEEEDQYKIPGRFWKAGKKQKGQKKNKKEKKKSSSVPSPYPDSASS